MARGRALAARDPGGRPSERILAVDGVSIHLLPNEVLGIVGESGSGKSTLALCLVALYRPDSGRIVFDGGGRLGRQSRAARKPVAYFLRCPLTISGTNGRNMMNGPDGAISRSMVMRVPPSARSLRR